MTRHRTDVLSLVFGLVFVVIGVAGLADVLDLELLDVDWMWPSILIAAGLGILLTLGAGRAPTSDDADAEGGVAEPPDAPTRSDETVPHPSDEPR